MHEISQYITLIHTSEVYQIDILTQSIHVVSFIIDDTSEIQRKQTLNKNAICATIISASYRSLSILANAVGETRLCASVLTCSINVKL